MTVEFAGSASQGWTRIRATSFLVMLGAMVLLFGCHRHEKAKTVLFRDAHAEIVLATESVSGFLKPHVSFEVLLVEGHQKPRRILSGGRLSGARLSATRLASGRLAATSSSMLAAEVSRGEWVEYALDGARAPDQRLREALAWVAGNEACFAEGRVYAAVALARLHAPEAAALLRKVDDLVELSAEQRALVRDAGVGGPPLP